MRRIHKKLIAMILSLALVFGMGSTVYAANYSGDVVQPGLSGIQPEDTLTLPDRAGWATLTAKWGVRVIFKDWDGTELQSKLVPVDDNTPGSSVAPNDPARAGYTFDGWDREDSNKGTASIGSDKSVSGITGPGPIVFIAKYVSNTPPSPDPEPETGDLTVSKTVVSDDEDSNEKFAFTITLDDADVDDTYGDITFEEGIARVTLKDGEEITAEGLPAGTRYEVIEDDYSDEGYVTTSTGDTGVIGANDTAIADFTNTKTNSGGSGDEPDNPGTDDKDTSSPGTGDNAELPILALLLVISGGAAAGTLVYRRKKLD